MQYAAISSTTVLWTLSSPLPTTMSSSNAPYLEQAAYVDAARILQDTQPVPLLELAPVATPSTQPHTTASTTASVDLDSIGEGQCGPCEITNTDENEPSLQSKREHWSPLSTVHWATGPQKDRWPHRRSRRPPVIPRAVSFRPPRKHWWRQQRRTRCGLREF